MEHSGHVQVIAQRLHLEILLNAQPPAFLLWELEGSVT